MIINKTDTDKEVYIIAEIGNNHEGDFKAALKMLQEAAACGVNAVKFQTFKTEFYVSRDNPDRFKRLKSFELTYDQFTELSHAAASEGVDFISTPFELESAQFLSGIVSALKISSSDNNFYPLLKKVASFDLPILLSGGILDIEGLKKSMRFLESEGHDNIVARTCLMHCVCSYPVPPESANLRAITDMRENFVNTIGYSDHTLGINAVSAAVALGARIVEKHFTLDHHYSEFRDHQLSANPSEMKQIVENIRLVNKMLGHGRKEPLATEKDIEPIVRRSIRASRALRKGEVIREADLKWVRPAGGFSPGCESELISKIVLCDINEDELLSNKNLNL